MKVMQEEDLTFEQKVLREQLRLLSQNVNNEIYEQRKYIFGKVSTIIEAAIPDREQRKSLKDLISDAVFTPSYWNNLSFQFEQIASANKFKLWNEPPVVCTNETVVPENAYNEVKVETKE
jgi:hypothetical protein